MRFKIIRDDDRYNRNSIVGVNTTRLAGGEFPAEFYVEGLTEDQAEDICWLLSYSKDPGCDDLFYAEEVKPG